MPYDTISDSLVKILREMWKLRMAIHPEGKE
jgi:hypothetical protein